MVAEVVEMVARRNLDFCCLQETKWKGEGARSIEGGGRKYKFFWKGCKDGVSGVGVLVAEKWIQHVVEVCRINERIMVVKIALGKRVFSIISAYAPQKGRIEKEKEKFWAAMSEALSLVKSEESLFLGGDLNGHVGEKAVDYSGVHMGKEILKVKDCWSLQWLWI